jgi:aminoglycoside/choline kinase family phosphotransferase
VTETQDQRLNALNDWVQDVLGASSLECAPASGDASFRRYFRFTAADGTWIGMDAPPAQEPLGPFLRVAERLADIGLNVPLIHARNEQQGFLLISDLGSRQYLHALAADGHDDYIQLYSDAIDSLVLLQSRGSAFARELPAYDEALLTAEMELFPRWYLQSHLGIELDTAAQQMWQRLVAVLVQAALAQPRVVVHRDYHSRNLMVVAANNPGILDFQDAVFGPITYDLVSLLEDCYIALPESMEHQLIELYRQRALDVGVAVMGRDEFMAGYDLMGVQRHLKAAGIFARLNHRDGKPGYLADIPRTLAYVLRAADRSPDCQPFAQFLRHRVPAASAVALP